MTNEQKGTDVSTLPTIIYAKRQVSYSVSSIIDQEDGPTTLEDLIDLALDYASDDISNANIQYYLVAEWHDDEDRIVRSSEYDWSGNLVEDSVYTYPKENK